MAKNVLTDILSEPLNGAQTAKVNIHAGDGNLTIDKLTHDEQVLASGALEYLEKQGLPTRTLDASSEQATLTLKAGGGGQPWFRFPWAACNGATEWQIHLNPHVSLDITAHTDGGNVKLDLAGMIITHVMADTGGGKVDVVLPDHATNLDVVAKTGAGSVNVQVGRGLTGNNSVNAQSGAGNVNVHIADEIAARIHASSGLGKVIVDSRFNKTDQNTYQTSDYGEAVDMVDITVKSGAGNVSVDTQ